MTNIITSVFSWIGSIISTLSQIIIIDNWSLLDFYIYPAIFIIIMSFILKVLKKRKKNEKSE